METQHNGALDRAKKEAKRLFALGKKAHGHLRIGTLSDAQTVVAALKNCSTWHELEERSKRSPITPPSAVSPLGQAMAAAKSSDAPNQIFLGKSGIVCCGPHGAHVKLPLLGSDPDFLTRVQWIGNRSGVAIPLAAAALRQAKAEGDNREFFLVGTTSDLAAAFKDLGDLGRFEWIQRDANDMFPAINPMETHPGERQPHSSSRAALLSLLAELGGSGTSLLGSHGALSHAIDLAYRKKSDDEEPNQYELGSHADVDQALEQINPMQKPATWWMARDILEISGNARLAQKSQSMAVPTIMDVAAALPALDCVYGKVQVNGRKLLSVLAENFSDMQRFAPDLFCKSNWWPSADLRGLGFDISNGRMLGGDASLRYLWARVVARRYVSSIGALRGSDNWMDMDVGSGDGAKLRRREIARQFKSRDKLVSMTIIDGLDNFSLTSNAQDSLLQDTQDARKHGHSLSVFGRLAPPWIDLASLRVDIESVDGSVAMLSYAAHTYGGTASGHCHYDIGLWEIWLGSSSSCDKELALAARRSKNPEAAILLISQAYPSGTWEWHAEQAAGDLPFQALDPHEMAAIADREISRLFPNKS